MHKIWKKLTTVFQGAAKRETQKNDDVYSWRNFNSSLAEASYELVKDREYVIELFSRLERTLRSHIQSIGGKQIIMERGFLSEDRRYFYIQLLSDDGYLFEESDKGWLIAQADKIMHENRFLRRQRAWDAVAVMLPVEKDKLLRISSSRFGEQLMCYPIYEDALLSDLPPLAKFRKKQKYPLVSLHSSVRWET